MNQILYILFGWLLGLASPTIVDVVRSHIRKREVAAALRVELEDLQYRLAISSLRLIQSHGSLDKKFVVWLQPIVDRYLGDEPNQAIRRLVGELVNADEANVSKLSNFFRAKEGVGSSLKTFQASFLETHLSEISKLPISTQRKIHEFRNQLHLLNQDIVKSEDYLKLTFNTSIGEENHRRVTEDLNRLYSYVQDRCRLVADKIEAILSGL